MCLSYSVLLKHCFHAKTELQNTHNLNVHIEIKSTVTYLYLSETKMTSQIEEQWLKAENDKLKDILRNNIYVTPEGQTWD